MTDWTIAAFVVAGLGPALGSQGDAADSVTEASGISFELSATVDPDSVVIGQRMTLSVALRGVPEGARVVFPVLADTGVVSALGLPLVAAEEDGRGHSARYALAAWDVGELELPAGEVQLFLPGEEILIPLPEVSVHVGSVLPARADPDTLPLRAPSDVVGSSWSLAEKLSGAALLLAALLASIVYLRRRGVTQPVPPVPARPARERAIEALKRLEKSGLAESGEMKAFFSALSEILREFIWDSHRAWGPDLTSSELTARLEAAAVSEEDVKRLAGLLEGADAVKFARRKPKIGQALLALQTADRWVSAFELPIAEPEPVDEAGFDEGEMSEEESVLALEEVFAQAVPERPDEDGAEPDRS